MSMCHVNALLVRASRSAQEAISIFRLVLWDVLVIYRLRSVVVCESFAVDVDILGFHLGLCAAPPLMIAAELCESDLRFGALLG